MITQRRLSKHPSRETDGWTAKAGLLYAVRAQRSNARLATVQRATARDTQGRTRTKKKGTSFPVPFNLVLAESVVSDLRTCHCLQLHALTRICILTNAIPFHAYAKQRFILHALMRPLRRRPVPETSSFSE